MKIAIAIMLLLCCTTVFDSRADEHNFHPLNPDEPSFIAKAVDPVFPAHRGYYRRVYLAGDYSIKKEIK